MGPLFYTVMLSIGVIGDYVSRQGQRLAESLTGTCIPGTHSGVCVLGQPRVGD